jgi:hypothetical protein
MLTSLFDLLALGRLHTIYFVSSTSHSAVFLLNSRLGHFSAATYCSHSKYDHNKWLLFSRSYEDNLPSSLTRVISRALEYSSRPPVSVLVRSPSTARSYFLEVSSYTIGSTEVSPCALPSFSLAGLPTSQPRSSTD